MIRRPKDRSRRWFDWRILALVACDACALLVAIGVAFLLRFEGRVPSDHWEGRGLSTAVAVVVFLILFGLHRLYHQLWRFVSLDSLFAIARATAYGTVLMVLLQHMLDTRVMPRSIIILTWLLSAIFVGSIRLALRFAYQRLHLQESASAAMSIPRESRQRTLIIGAEELGADLVNYLRLNPQLGFNPVGFIDGDPTKQGLYVRGLRVVGSLSDLGRTLERLKISEVIIAVPGAPGSLVRNVVEQCRDLGVRVKTLPNLHEALRGIDRPLRLREVAVEDLLRREPVKVNLEEIAAYLRGKRVLVTGGGGSIGSELCRQIATWEPARLVVLDVDETGVFNVTEALREDYPSLDLHSVVADIRDSGTIARHFATHSPEIVFHAAAYKHVPLMEDHPLEAIRTNVLGTRVLARLSRQSLVDRFILVSSDKAVNPINVMGATKRIAERVLQAETVAVDAKEKGHATKFMSVRFGNVLGSRGSVLPIFQRQIEQGGPVTVTHPDVQRYFMTIPEAVQLVIQAGALGKGGEIFVLDMGQPVKILDLARDLIRLSGYEPERDIPITFVGLRPGEKLFEELLTAEEELTHSRHEWIYVCPSTNHGAAGEGGAEETERLRHALEELGRLAREGASEDVLKRAIGEIVPTYKTAGGTSTAMSSKTL